MDFAVLVCGHGFHVRTGWWPRVAAGGVRDEVALPCPYTPPADPDPDGWLPIDQALDRRDTTGDVERYERDLRQILAP